MKGFSPRNLKYMRAFAEAWPEPEFVQQVAAQLPRFHSCTLLDRVKGKSVREWYARQTIEHGWSRNVLLAQIETRLHERAGKALTNFKGTLAPPHSDLAQQALKDPYVFDFLTLGPYAQERDLERGLLEHVRDFLLELGVGFAFVGSQVHLEVGGEDFYVDLLFFHLRLRCFVVIELNTGEFKPEYAGKMNFYLSAADAQLRRDGDQPSIGLVLCKEKNKVVVEYALRDTRKPIGVSAFLENADLLLQVVELPRHPSVDRVRDHRDDELERRRQHRGEPRLPVLGRLFKLPSSPGIMRNSLR